MPIYKPTLTPREQAKYLSIARELEAAGTRVDIPDEWLENARFLRITIAGSPESLIYQLSPSIVLYSFQVRLLAEHSATLQEFEVATRWDPGVFSCYAEGRTPYRFSPGLDFDVKEVLNDRIERGLRLRRGDIREGWLLAMGNKPVPEEYGRGRPASVEVRFFDQFWQSQVASSTLAVERSTQTRRSSLRPGRGLYEREDPPVSMERGVDPDAIVPLGPPPPLKCESEPFASPRKAISKLPHADCPESNGSILSGPASVAMGRKGGSERLPVPAPPVTRQGEQELVRELLQQSGELLNRIRA